MDAVPDACTLITVVIYRMHSLFSRAWGGVVVKGSIPGGVTREFFRGIRQFHVPGVDSAS
jgi:hypothetical protein